MPKYDSKNITNLADDLAKRRTRVTSLPAVLYIESVYGCPYSCVMCEVRELKARLISKELLKKVEPLYPHLYMLGIHGDGEPLLGNDIDYFIDAARKNNIILHMNSTGFFLSPDLIERLIKGTKLSIRFSIHAGTNKTYARIMGHDLDKVKANIKYLIERNSLIGDRDNEFWCSFIVMKENIDEIPAFLHMADKIGIKQVRFMKLYANRFTIKGVIRKEEGFKFYHSEQFNNKIKSEFLKRLPEIKNLARNLGITIEPGDLEYECHKRPLIDSVVIQKIFKKFWPIEPAGFCVAPWVGGCVLKQNGEIWLCCGLHYVIGNLFRQDFDEIWNSVKMQIIRKEFKKKRLLKYCRGCRTVRLEEYPKAVLKEFKERLIL
jgi:radical SAM protein with 4Fe4S-binding SPASM domain